MILNVITPGYVVQQWDTEAKAWVGQEFVAGDDREVEYADYSQPDVDDGIDPNDLFELNGEEPYLNFEMVQPK